MATKVTVVNDHDARLYAAAIVALDPDVCPKPETIDRRVRGAVSTWKASHPGFDVSRRVGWPPQVRRFPRQGTQSITYYYNLARI